MLTNGKNECIRCTITNCAYNDQEAKYSTLESIHVVTHENNPMKKECTDCESFRCK